MLHSHVKFSAAETDRQTDRQTPIKQYAPDLSMRGHKKIPKGPLEVESKLCKRKCKYRFHSYHSQVW